MVSIGLICPICQICCSDLAMTTTTYTATGAETDTETDTETENSSARREGLGISDQIDSYAGDGRESSHNTTEFIATTCKITRGTSVHRAEVRQYSFIRGSADEEVDIEGVDEGYETIEDSQTQRKSCN